MQELYAESQLDPSTHSNQQEFVQEIVHSTLPLALHKAEANLVVSSGVLEGNGQPIFNRSSRPSDDLKEPINVKITWRGGGKSVALARAGDDDWKGRQPMEPDEPSSENTWSVWVSLLPGTHHIRFIVDDQWRLADDLPTAVDDEGSLANYVAVPSPHTPPQSTAISAAPAKQAATHHVHSFWSSTSTHDSVAEPSSGSDWRKWTDEIPPELIAAAREEEAYLSYTSAMEYDNVGPNGHPVPVAAPNTPPAPALPRHLDKLILNVKVTPPLATTRARDREREKEREREHRRRQGRSLLGMTSTVTREFHKEGKETDVDHPGIPITTASGTDVTSAHLSSPMQVHTRLGLDGPGLTDDASVLPVPSHVVLHHLSTSAIRNGVLAVGNTTRYRQKYLTTIYYKPT